MARLVSLTVSAFIIEKTMFKLAIIGGGPNSVYALDLLLRHVQGPGRRAVHHIVVFEASGQFGAGLTHSRHTPDTAKLNRVAGQISLGVGKFYPNPASGKEPYFFDNFIDWSQDKLARTGSRKYDIQPTDWPSRNLLGEALADAFEFYVKQLRLLEDIEVELVSEEVVNVTKSNDQPGYTLDTSTGTFKSFDKVLFVTGNIRRSLDENTWLGQLKNDCLKCNVELLENPYPLQDIETNLSDAEKVVVIGAGVTAVDLMLFIGELGKRDKSSPKKVFPVSRNGIFSYARAVNQKQVEKQNFHDGYVFTIELVDRLHAAADAHRGTRQLEFELEILPLLIAEMTLKYYGTLFGKKFEADGLEILRARVDAFVADFDCWCSIDGAVQYLTGEICEKAEAILSRIDSSLELESAHEFGEELLAFARVVLDNFELDDNQISILQLLEDARRKRSFFESASQYRFSWQDISNPLDVTSFGNLEDYKTALLAFMREDIQKALQGNVCNPYKAACDGVWRDLRDTIIHAVQKEGLTPRSYEQFLDVYLPLHNRICDGPSIETMRRVIELIERGVICLDFAFDVNFEPSADCSSLVLVGPFGKMNATCIILGTIDLYKSSYQNNRLYKSMIQRGAVRPWRPTEAHGRSFGLDLDNDFHPIDRTNRVNRDFTFLGPACEGYHIFQHTLARPDKEQAAVTNLKAWLRELLHQSEGQEIRAAASELK